MTESFSPHTDNPGADGSSSGVVHTGELLSPGDPRFYTDREKREESVRREIGEEAGETPVGDNEGENPFEGMDPRLVMGAFAALLEHERFRTAKAEAGKHAAEQKTTAAERDRIAAESAKQKAEDARRIADAEAAAQRAAAVTAKAREDAAAAIAAAEARRADDANQNAANIASVLAATASQRPRRAFDIAESRGLAGALPSPAHPAPGLPGESPWEVRARAGEPVVALPGHKEIPVAPQPPRGVGVSLGRFTEPSFWGDLLGATAGKVNERVLNLTKFPGRNGREAISVAVELPRGRRLAQELFVAALSEYDSLGNPVGRNYFSGREALDLKKSTLRKIQKGPITVGSGGRVDLRPRVESALNCLNELISNSLVLESMSESDRNKVGANQRGAMLNKLSQLNLLVENTSIAGIEDVYDIHKNPGLLTAIKEGLAEMQGWYDKRAKPSARRRMGGRAVRALTTPVQAIANIVRR